MRIGRCSNARISGFFVALLFGLVFVFVVLQYWSTHPEADSFVGLDQEIPAFESSNPDQAFQLLNDRHHESPGDSVIAVALATVSGLKGDRLQGVNLREEIDGFQTTPGLVIWAPRPRNSVI